MVQVCIVAKSLLVFCAFFSWSKRVQNIWCIGGWFSVFSRSHLFYSVLMYIERLIWNAQFNGWCHSVWLYNLCSFGATSGLQKSQCVWGQPFKLCDLNYLVLSPVQGVVRQQDHRVAQGIVWWTSFPAATVSAACVFVCFVSMCVHVCGPHRKQWCSLIQKAKMEDKLPRKHFTVLDWNRLSWSKYQSMNAEM